MWGRKPTAPPPPPPWTAQPRMVALVVVLLIALLGMPSFLWPQQKTQVSSKEQQERGAEGSDTWCAQPWMVALGMTLTVLLLGRSCWQQRKKIQALSKEQQRERAEKEAAQAEKEAAQAKEQRERSAKEKLQDELRWTRIPYLPRDKQYHAYAELKRALFQPADVFLDPDTAHPALHVSENKRSLQGTAAWENLTENPERFCGNQYVLGSESFTLGRHFWEVDVWDRKQWGVGVCGENVRRKDGDKMTPETGFWMVALNPGNDYRALTDPQTTLTHVSPPERVGVFLDYELGEVSFYNAIDGAHIFTFPHACFSEPVRPVFMLWRKELTPLTIRPAHKAVGRPLVSDTGSDPSLETPVARGLADGNGVPPTAASSLLQTSAAGKVGKLRQRQVQ